MNQVDNRTNPFTAQVPSELENLIKLMTNPDISLDDRVALTALESGNDFVKTVQDNLDAIKSSVSNIQPRENKTYFSTSTNDNGLLQVLVALRQYQRSKNTYERLQHICPNHLKSQIGDISFEKEENLLPFDILQDVVSIDNIEKASQNKIGKEFYQEKEAAIFEAIASGTPIEFLQEVFKVGILTDTSHLDKKSLMSLNGVIAKIRSVAESAIDAITLDDSGNAQHGKEISSPAIHYVDLEEGEKEKSTTESPQVIYIDNDDEQEQVEPKQVEQNQIETSQVQQIQVERAQTQEDSIALSEEQNPLFMNYAENVVERMYSITCIFITFCKSALTYEEAPVTCSETLEVLSNSLIERCIVWIRKD